MIRWIPQNLSKLMVNCITFLPKRSETDRDRYSSEAGLNGFRL